MKTFISLLITALLSLNLLHAQYISKVWKGDLGDGRYQNPIINADYSDPDVCLGADGYYMVASSFNCVPGLPVLFSRDLVNWSLVGHALSRQVPEDFTTRFNTAAEFGLLPYAITTRNITYTGAIPISVFTWLRLPIPGPGRSRIWSKPAKALSTFVPFGTKTAKPICLCTGRQPGRT